jgi:hypothetical protein
MAFLALRRDDVDVERLVRRTATTSLPERRRQRSPRRRPTWEQESVQRGKGSAWERFWDFLQSLKIYVLDLDGLSLGCCDSLKVCKAQKGQRVLFLAETKSWEAGSSEVKNNFTRGFLHQVLVGAPQSHA